MKEHARDDKQVLLNHFVEFPPWTKKFRIVPLVDVTNREALWHFWDTIPYGIIAINYLGLRKKRRLYLKAQSLGIKRVLGYNGTCISVLVGDNWLLDRTPVRGYFDDVTTMGFDAATTHDDFVYWDDPPDRRFDRVHKTLDRARALVRQRPTFDTIGIVKGSTKNEIEFCIDRLIGMNIKMVAFPCSELMFERRPDAIQEFLRYSRHLKLWRWLIGIGSPHEMWRLDANCFSSPKWCYSATWGYEYSDAGVKENSGFPRCQHSLCRSLLDRRVPKDIRLARHNILNLIGMNKTLVRHEQDGYR